MNKSTSTSQLTLLIFVIFFTFSCSKDNELLEKSQSLSNDYFVELSAIKEIASGIHFPIEGSSSLKSTEHQAKSICSIEAIRNSYGKTSFYIINYNEGGFVLLSSDKRTQPVLGFSVNNNFEVDENAYPPGLRSWMDNAKGQIEALQLSNIEQSPQDKIAWDRVLESIIGEISSLKSEPPDDDCYDHTEIYTDGPLGTPRFQDGIKQAPLMMICPISRAMDLVFKFMPVAYQLQ